MEPVNGLLVADEAASVLGGQALGNRGAVDLGVGVGPQQTGLDAPAQTLDGAGVGAG